MSNPKVFERQLGKLYKEHEAFFKDKDLKSGVILILAPRIFRSIGIVIHPAMFPDGKLKDERIQSKDPGVDIVKGMAVMFLRATPVPSKSEWTVEVLHNNRIYMFWACDAKMKVVVPKKGKKQNGKS